MYELALAARSFGATLSPSTATHTLVGNDSGDFSDTIQARYPTACMHVCVGDVPPVLPFPDNRR